MCGTQHHYNLNHNTLYHVTSTDKDLAFLKLVHKVEEMTVSSKAQTPTQGYRDHEEPGENNTTKGNSKLPITNHKEMITHELPDD